MFQLIKKWNHFSLLLFWKAWMHMISNLNQTSWKFAFMKRKEQKRVFRNYVTWLALALYSSGLNVPHCKVIHFMGRFPTKKMMPAKWRHLYEKNIFIDISFFIRLWETVGCCHFAMSLYLQKEKKRKKKKVYRSPIRSYFFLYSVIIFQTKHGHIVFLNLKVNMHFPSS